MPQLPLDSSCQSEYEDGYIHDETALRDVSPYVDGKNIFSDILEKRPEAEHGRMVRFTVFWRGQRLDIDWRGLPDNARPIRFRHGFHQWMSDGTEITGWSGLDVGYQYTDENRRNQQVIRKL